MKLAICGSMAFAKQILKIKKELENLGHDVIAPENIEKYANGTINIENKWEKIELDVIKAYFEKIKSCDAILVANYTKNNILNYIGGNSLIEIAFAHVLDKKIYLLNDIPKMNYSDEIEAMGPFILNGDINKLKN